MYCEIVPDEEFKEGSEHQDIYKFYANFKRKCFKLEDLRLFEVIFLDMLCQSGKKILRKVFMHF